MGKLDKVKLANEKYVKLAEMVTEDLFELYGEKTRLIAKDIPGKQESCMVHALIINTFVGAHCKFMETNYGEKNKTTRYHFLKGLERAVKYNFRHPNV